ncbi:MAG: DUF2490 domain-containing protein [Sphingobacteriales bacterium]|nr:DUF2490 domain-containing protein [Sphingobacteriales bacterium]
MNIKAFIKKTDTYLKYGVLLFFVLFWCSSNTLMAQERDGSLWAGGEINYNFNKKWRFNTEIEARFSDTATHFQSVYIEPAFRYKLTKTWRLDASYRYVYRSSLKHSQRVGVGIGKGWKINKHWQVQHRLRYQRDFISDPSKNDIEQSLRLNTNIDYERHPRLTPNIGGEVFYALDRKFQKIYRYRGWGSLSMKLSKQWDCRLRYMYQNDFRKDDKEKCEIDHIVEAFFSLNL